MSNTVRPLMASSSSTAVEPTRVIEDLLHDLNRLQLDDFSKIASGVRKSFDLMNGGHYLSSNPFLRRREIFEHGWDEVTLAQFLEIDALRKCDPELVAKFLVICPQLCESYAVKALKETSTAACHRFLNDWVSLAPRVPKERDYHLFHVLRLLREEEREVEEPVDITTLANTESSGDNETALEVLLEIYLSKQIEPSKRLSVFRELFPLLRGRSPGESCLKSVYFDYYLLSLKSDDGLQKLVRFLDLAEAVVKSAPLNHLLPMSNETYTLDEMYPALMFAAPFFVEHGDSYTNFYKFFLEHPGPEASAAAALAMPYLSGVEAYYIRKILELVVVSEFPREKCLRALVLLHQHKKSIRRSEPQFFQMLMSLDPKDWAVRVASVPK